jgi:hypothetical protein
MQQQYNYSNDALSLVLSVVGFHNLSHSDVLFLEKKKKEERINRWRIVWTDLT